jgi:uracil-DNA glycosylase family 4
MGITRWVARDQPAPQPMQDRVAMAPPPRGEESREARIARMDWAALQAEVARCTACGLHKTRTQTVFGVGDRHARWMLIGEAPGAEEDRKGEPFVGRAGQLLNAMLLAVGLRREEVFIANILKSRPPNNRDPRPEEVAACAPFLRRQVELIGPKVILALGRVAAQNLLNTDTRLGAMRGKVYRYSSAEIPVVVTYHPAYLLRTPKDKRKAWEDLQFAIRVMAQG